ncbi:hypothetical protein TI39_contig5839g00023 [Zymoseptoria brevis]|uniref:Uncharacterized protein n=1 Tax=Zymoseptoria brevis TaxID=1047168 RepID=A0A0F4G6E6_9PEZI|nr:hypothetical protein TI39_contig5839g00023 [Zymoseptoria brevis]
MADKDTLGEGDFTKSQNWPQICDILDAQNQVMAKHMIEEAAKNKNFREQVMKTFKKQHSLISQVATALDIDEADINASKPTKQTPAADKDDEAVKALSEELLEEVKVLTIDYSDSGNRDKVKSKETKNVTDGTLVQDWVAHIEKKMQNRYYAEWQTLTQAQQKRFFFKMGRMLIAEEKEAEASDKAKETAEAQGSKRKATQASGGGSVQGRRCSDLMDLDTSNTVRGGSIVRAGAGAGGAKRSKRTRRDSVSSLSGSGDGSMDELVGGPKSINLAEDDVVIDPRFPAGPYLHIPVVKHGGRPGTKSSKSRNTTHSIGMDTLLPRQLSADFREAVSTPIPTKAQESELKVMKREQKSDGDDQDAAEEKEEDKEDEEEEDTYRHPTPPFQNIAY